MIKTMDGRAARRVKTWETVSCVLALGGQVALRYAYERSGHSFWAGFFGTGNNSVWEQAKALFFGLLFCSLPELFFSRAGFFNVLSGKAASLTLLVLSFAAFYYTYTGAFDLHSDVADLAGGAALTVLCCVICCRFILRGNCGPFTAASGVLLLAILTTAFSLCTLWPPEVGLFRDPLTGRYGLITRQDAVFAGADYARLGPSANTPGPVQMLRAAVLKGVR